MEKETWKTYPEYPFIQGSSLGRVRTVDRYVKVKGHGIRLVKGHILKQRDNKGYLQVQFSVNGKKVDRKIHRLVAQTFIPNPDNLPEVNHIDCDPTNNCVDNLEWISHQENIAYRDKLGHIARHNKPKKPVITVNLKTLEVLRFESRREAGRQLGISNGSINSVLTGQYRQANGYWFTNADENAVESTRAKFGDEVADKVEALMSENELQPA